MTTRTLMVTGASGHLGRRAVEVLLDRGTDKVVAATRDPSKLADLAARGAEIRRLDFDDPESLATAFAGVDRALIVSTDSMEFIGRRAQQHTAAIAAAAQAGVRHLVYTSFSNPTEDSANAIGEDHRLTEEALAASGVGYTALRNNLYADLLLGSLPQAIESGTLTTARGSGAIAYVTREDCALAAAAALADSFEGQQAVVVSGPEAITGDQLAALATTLGGRVVKHQSIPSAALAEGMTQAGLPRPIADLLVSFETAAERGELSEVSSQMGALIGRKPTSVARFLEGALPPA